jgi:hypothetical protein
VENIFGKKREKLICALALNHSSTDNKINMKKKHDQKNKEKKRLKMKEEKKSMKKYKTCFFKGSHFSS